ncbi:MAG TPA: hypothetical protein VFR31_01600 [Thermoanaerobaculia bacterium]|nr:hypothetical protein [Thermoanaerobaculia bacterium]
MKTRWIAMLLLAGVLMALAAPAQEMEYRLPQDRSVQNSIQLASSSFSGWIRYPAESRQWTTMSSATAYFRDVFVGGQTYISGAADGDSWQASAVRPDGQTRNWSSVTFHASYGGNQNCFVSPAWTICGTTSLIVLWYADSQCVETGEWTMTFSFRGAPFYQGRFTTLPEIPPDEVPAVLDQLTYQPVSPGDPVITYDSACIWRLKIPFGEDVTRIGPCGPVFCWPPQGIPSVCVHVGEPLPMWRYGCYLMAATMQTSYHGGPGKPVTFDTWLRDNDGYTQGGTLKYESIVEYAQSEGVDMSYVRTLEKKDANGDPVQITSADPEFRELEPAICSYGPQIVAVSRHNDDGTIYNHFLLVTGLTGDKSTYKVIDPWGGLQTTLDDGFYLNQFWDSRIMRGPEYTYVHPNGIAVHFHSPGELLITDPQGRRAGLDPVAGIAYEEIPGAVYQHTAVSDIAGEGPDVASKVLSVPQAEAGEYSLQVTGTGTGYYTLDLTTYGAQRSTSALRDLPIAPGVVHTYSFEKTDTGGGLELSGRFDGKGQRPVDVNKLLTYIAPSEVSTPLAAGTSQYSLIVVYGAGLLPETFTADLNGAAVSSAFHPAPGGFEVVPLNLAPGRNVLKLSVDGNVRGRTVSDTDRLVFVVP